MVMVDPAKGYSDCFALPRKRQETRDYRSWFYKMRESFTFAVEGCDASFKRVAWQFQLTSGKLDGLVKRKGLGIRSVMVHPLKAYDDARPSGGNGAAASYKPRGKTPGGQGVIHTADLKMMGPGFTSAAQEFRFTLAVPIRVSKGF